MLSKQRGRTRQKTCGFTLDVGTAVVRAAFGLRFHHQPRFQVVATGPIAHADEDDDQIETWMIGQGQELSGNRRTVGRC